ncbi:MAG: flavin reductase family protein [Eubacteriales bacterium]|nr:flavin reductase family protein [Eubacteriales bacterium]
MKQVNCHDMAPQFIAQMSRKGGAFLNVKGADGRINTMTIGWGFIGHSWNTDTMVVMVRASRYTKALLDETGVFTVSVPVDQDLKKALALCGTKSGRDMDKFAAAGLTALPGRQVDCPIVEQCALQFECSVVMQQDMQGELLRDGFDARYYADHDYHTLYYGKIVACYRMD